MLTNAIWSFYIYSLEFFFPSLHHFLSLSVYSSLLLIFCFYSLFLSIVNLTASLIGLKFTVFIIGLYRKPFKSTITLIKLQIETIGSICLVEMSLYTIFFEIQYFILRTKKKKMLTKRSHYEFDVYMLNPLQLHTTIWLEPME